MLGKGTHDPGLNPNAYPMTDSERHPSAVRIPLCGETLGLVDPQTTPQTTAASSPGTRNHKTKSQGKQAPMAI